MRTGLLLGAGASYECGMPMVWELTNQIRCFATPKLLRERNIRSKAANLGFPDLLIEELIQLIARPELHYESIIGNLEIKVRRHSGRHNGRHYHALHSDLTEMVYFLLLDRHSRLATVLPTYMRFLDGLAGLVSHNQPLWIFSLNHDLIVESFAAHRKIPINSGSFDTIELPLPENSHGIKSIAAELSTAERFHTKGLPFFIQGKVGINIFKLHGSLDTFLIHNGNDIIKLVPVENNISGVLKTVELANSLLQHKLPHAPHIRTTNEIMYLDQGGEIQFARRTILTGAFKFNEEKRKTKFNMMTHFRDNLLQVDVLVTVGYGFADPHVNGSLRTWLEFAEARKLQIIDPFRTTIPSDFLHLAPQVTLSRKTALDFFEQFSSSPLSPIERQIRDGLSRARDVVAAKYAEQARLAYPNEDGH